MFSKLPLEIIIRIIVELQEVDVLDPRSMRGIIKYAAERSVDVDRLMFLDKIGVKNYEFRVENVNEFMRA